MTGTQKKSPTADLEALMGLSEDNTAEEEAADKILAVVEKVCEDAGMAIRVLGMVISAIGESFVEEDE